MTAPVANATIEVIVLGAVSISISRTSAQLTLHSALQILSFALH